MARHWHATSVLTLGLCLTAVGAARAADITMEATKSDGGAVRVCVGINSGGEKVAGTQNDLVWDGSCARLKADSCQAVPESKKPLHGNAPANQPNTYRALVFALDNVDPVRDGALYCCDFELTAGSECCAVKLDRLGLSDPVGKALSVTAQPASLCLATGAVAPAGAVPAAPAAEPPPPDTAPWMWIGLTAIAVIVAVVLATRKKRS